MENKMDFEFEDLLESKKKVRRGYRDRDSFWSEEYLWKHAKDLPVETIELEPLLDLDITWTITNIFDFSLHVKKINEANYKRFPIIMSEDGKIMDGYHRVCKALLDGATTIQRKKFEVNPPPERKV